VANQLETFMEEFSNILHRNVGATAAVGGAPAATPAQR
jgi:hypothetical protein